MPRNAWAKVYCDLLRHPKIIGRPDSDVRLFLGLILYAKEYAPETGIVALTPSAMRTQFGIKASPASVKAGLSYFVKCGVLVEDGEYFRIKDFATRQKNDSSAARTRDWRERHRDGDGASQTSSPQPSPPRHSLSHASPDVEGEVEVDLGVSSQGLGGVGGKGTTACESVDNAALSREGISESDKAQIQKLFFDGRGPEAVALLASLRAAQVQEKIQKSPVPEAPR